MELPGVLASGIRFQVAAAALNHQDSCIFEKIEAVASLVSFRCSRLSESE